MRRRHPNEVHRTGWLGGRGGSFSFLFRSRYVCEEMCVSEGERVMGESGRACLMEVTSQPRATANLQMRVPRKPFPPHTMILFTTDMLG